MKKLKEKIKYYKNKKYFVLLAIVLVFLLTGTYFFKISNQNTDYVLKINEEYISSEEFLLYLFEQEKAFEEIGGVDIWQTDFDGIPAKEVAKKNAINSIILLKSAVYKSKDLNISLTKEEEKSIKVEAKSLKDTVEEAKENIDIPLCIYEKFQRENLLEKKIYNELTNNFVINEKDFNEYFKKYIKENSNKLNKINLDYIFIENNSDFDAFEKSEEISKTININTDFKTIENTQYIKSYINIDLEKGMFDRNVEEKIYTLSENSISNIIESREGFYIFKINKRLKQDIKNVKEMVKEEYINIEKNKLYNTQSKAWSTNINIKENIENLSKI